MDEDTLLIPPFGDGLAHYVYIGVYAFSEDPTHPGGYRLYDNTVTQQLSWRVRTDFNSRAGGPYGDVMATLMANLYAVSGAIYQSTDGTAYIQHFDFWNNTTNCGGLGCHIVISDPVFGGTFCGGGYGCDAMNGCFASQFAYYYPIGTPNTPDPEPWSSATVSDIWKYRAYTTITTKN